MIDISKKNIKRLQDISSQIRLDALEMARASANNGSHLGGSLSCVEIMAVLYGEVLRLDPRNPEWNGRDRFFPSKNHCVLAHFPALAACGYIEREELLEFQKDGGRLTGYPRDLKIGLEYSGGSLGMALSVAIGIALSFREKKMSNRVFVLMGDGELNEGSVWEGIMAASQYKLDNLVAIIDRNHLSYDGNTENIMGIAPLDDKFRSFHWNPITCDGHDVEQLLNAFSAIEEGKPNVIIADTVKGKGISFMENRPEWHHSRITQEQYEIARRELMEGRA